jgi:hypothetical protein
MAIFRICKVSSYQHRVIFISITVNSTTSESFMFTCGNCFGLFIDTRNTVTHAHQVVMKSLNTDLTLSVRAKRIRVLRFWNLNNFKQQHLLIIWSYELHEYLCARSESFILTENSWLSINPLSTGSFLYTQNFYSIKIISYSKG